MKIPCYLLAGAVLANPLLADVRETVACREIAFSQSAEARDSEAFRAFLDADARFAGQTVLRGPAAVTEGWSVFLSESGPEISWRPQIVEVLEDAGLALTRGPYRVRGLDENGELSESWGTFNSVWRRGHDGQWRVLFDAGSPAAGSLPEKYLELWAPRPDCGTEAVKR